MGRANEDPKIVARRVKAQQALSTVIKDIEAEQETRIESLVDDKLHLKVKVDRLEQQNAYLHRENNRKQEKIGHLNCRINAGIDFRPEPSEDMVDAMAYLAGSFLNPSQKISELQQELRAEVDARMGVSNLRDYWKNRALAAEGLKGC